MSGNAAVCTVRKDAGDDPDITNGVPHLGGRPAHRTAASPSRAAAGVGRVTRPGLADAGR